MAGEPLVRDKGALERLARFAPVLAGLLALVLGLRQLAGGHPHEDAFILFEYARHVATGDGIVFWSGGPRAEGATDFLWMILLAATRRLGVDVAVGACVWNALGTALASAVLVRIAHRSGLRGATLAAWALASLGVALGASAAAGWVGFSTPLYCGVTLFLAELATDDEARRVRWTPLVALVVALLRPDGVGLALAFGVAGAIAARRVGAWSAYLRACAVAIAIGAAYFAWRWSYFGLLLPLPLYVKQAGVPALTFANLVERPLATLPGLAMHVKWMTSGLSAVPFLAVAAVFAWPERAHVRRALAVLACAALFLALLAPGRHTQDFAYRFQAPAGALCVLAAWSLACAFAADARRSRLAHGGALALVVAAFVPGALRARAELAWNARTSMDVLPARAARVLGASSSIALTEAGRLPYWTDARTFDAVGLNDPRAAREPMTQAYLREIDPDVVLLHVADALVFPTQEFAGAPPLVALERTELEPHVAPHLRELWGRELARLPDGVSPETHAALALARFLATSDGYELRLARYGGRYAHVWGVKRSFAGSQALLAELEAAQDPAAWRSYAQLAGLTWLAR